MKFSILALGAAMAGISCVSPCVAQLSVEATVPFRSTGGRLVSQNTELNDPFAQSIEGDKAAATAVDYFADPFQAAEVSDPASLNLSNGPGDIGVREKSLHVATKNVGPAPLEVLANVPEVGMVPIYWPSGNCGCVTPNPIAATMMRNWCTNGLWDNYAYERSRQCQHIQHALHGHNRYTQGCGSQCNTWSVNNVPACVANATTFSSKASIVEQELANCPQLPASSRQSGTAESQQTQANLPAAPLTRSTPAVASLPTATLR